MAAQSYLSLLKPDFVWFPSTVGFWLERAEAPLFAGV
jgi:hypothetical protein